MPAIGVAFILWCDVFYVTQLNNRIRFSMLAYFILSTFFLPAITAIWMKHRGIIATLMMKDRKDRYYPLIATFIFYGITLFMMQKVHGFTLVKHFFIATITAVAITLLITFAYKISLHMTGCGGVLGLLLYLQATNEIFLLPFILSWIIVCGATASSRLQLKAHTPLQLLCGLLCGCLVVYGGLKWVL